TAGRAAYPRVPFARRTDAYGSIGPGGGRTTPMNRANRRCRWLADHLCLARSLVRLDLVPSIGVGPPTRAWQRLVTWPWHRAGREIEPARTMIRARPAGSR